MKTTKRIKPFEVPRTEYSAFRQSFLGLLEGRSDFASKYQVEAFESKLLDPDFSDSPEVRRDRAIQKWLDTETTNRDTNQRLYLQEDDDVLFEHEGSVVTVGRFLRWVRRLISDTIGSTVDWEALTGSFSNGASTGVKRGAGTVPRKYLHGRDITEKCLTHFHRLNRSVIWSPDDVNIVPGNVMFTVPKKTTIDRVACKEPDLNMYCQKAVGDYFRRALRLRGINLNDQSVNQVLAYQGSKLGDLATVDLSSASDSVTRQLVICLLPFEWSALLFDLRSEFTLISGEWHENEMISSMGNAYTFELESLIFWALTRGVCHFTGMRGRVSVYGDDIICPVGVKDALTTTLAYFGFSLNLEKSFFEGSFRESCGKHYDNGKDVTPFYVRRVPINVSDWVHLLNSMRSWLSRQAVCGYLDSDFFPLWNGFREKLIPMPIQGGGDLDRRDILACPGRLPLARVAPKQVRREREEERLVLGAYLQWLDTADRARSESADTPRCGNQGRLAGFKHLSRSLIAEVVRESRREPMVTSRFTTDGKLTLSRLREPVLNRPLPCFVEEV